jgi:hypothetical protein
MQQIDWFIAVLFAAAAVAVSLALAAHGEPQSLWLWRDVLGVL